MDLSLRPFLDRKDCRSATFGTPYMEDLAGTTDWLASKRSRIRRETTSTDAASTDGGYSGSTASDDDFSWGPDKSPPTWPGWSLPGDQVVFAASCPDDTLKAVRDFFTHCVPAVVTEQAWDMKVTAFVNYAAIDVEVHVYAGADSLGGTTVALHRASRRDVVSFHRLAASVVAHLRAQPSPPASAGGGPVEPCSPSPQPDFDSDSEDDWLDDAEVDWALRATSAFEVVSSPGSTSKEEGLQMLASWAARQPKSREAIAEAIGAHAGLVQALLSEQTPLAELYPLAVALKFAVLESPSSLAAEVVLGHSAALPPIVAVELQEAREGVARHYESLQCPGE